MNHSGCGHNVSLRTSDDGPNFDRPIGGSDTKKEQEKW